MDNIVFTLSNWEEHMPSSPLLPTCLYLKCTSPHPPSPSAPHAFLSPHPEFTACAYAYDSPSRLFYASYTMCANYTRLLPLSLTWHHISLPLDSCDAGEPRPALASFRALKLGLMRGGWFEPSVRYPRGGGRAEGAGVGEGRAGTTRLTRAP